MRLRPLNCKSAACENLEKLIGASRIFSFEGFHGAARTQGQIAPDAEPLLPAP